MTMLIVGTAYALWSETLTIDGTIDTGDIDTVFENVVTSDSEPCDKDVSSITAELGADGKSITVTIDNAYPCIDYILEFDIVNYGSIPVHVMVSFDDLPDCMTFTMNPDLFNDYEQIESDGDSVHVVLTIHLSNNCDQDASYSFTIELTAGQWNEYPGI